MEFKKLNDDVLNKIIDSSWSTDSQVYPTIQQLKPFFMSDLVPQIV